MVAKSLRARSGLVVLGLGIAAGASMIAPALPPDGTLQVVGVDEGATLIDTSAEPTPTLPGVPGSVNRVLAWTGDAGFAGPAITAQIPTSIVDSLIAYGVPIKVASTGETP